MTHQQAELAAVQVAASARAEVESACIMAAKFPRNEMESRVRILEACRNLQFAEAAKYRKPVGGKSMEGPSIRFAEEAIRLWRNVKTIQSTIYDDPNKRIVNIQVIDLEANVSHGKQFIIEKTVERKDGRGREVIAERLNSYNEKVNIVVATEDEIQNKEAALASKVLRNNGLRLIPDNIVSEAMKIVDETVKAGVDKDPQRAKLVVIDNFVKINVKPMMLEKYLGHPVDTCSPAEIMELKQIHNSIVEGATTWTEIMATKSEGPKETEKAAIDPEPQPEQFEKPSEYDEAHAKWEKRQAGGQQTFKPGDQAQHTDVKAGAKRT